MQRRSIILIAAAFGAVIGALATMVDLRAVTRIPLFALDRALLSHGGLLVASLFAWSVFSAYWEKAAKNATPAKSSESRTSRNVHVFLVNLALLLEIAPIQGFGRFVPVSVPVMAAGLSVEALGLALAIWARRHLGRNWSGEITVKEEHQLVRTGPYRFFRHPIYAGLLAMYLGVAVVTGEWLAVIGFAMAVFAYWRKIRLEETTLSGAFGADYDMYRRGTW